MYVARFKLHIVLLAKSKQVVFTFTLQTTELDQESKIFITRCLFNLRFTSLCVCSKSACATSSNVLILLNRLLCESRMTLGCFRTASFRTGSLHLMSKLVGYFTPFMIWWTPFLRFYKNFDVTTNSVTIPAQFFGHFIIQQK